MESDVHGAAAWNFDDHGGAQSQYAALFYPLPARGRPTRYLFGDGICNCGDDFGGRLVGTFRHPTVVPAVFTATAGGISIAALQNGGGRCGPGTRRSGGGARHGRAVTDPALWPRICRSLSDFPGADP